ncbi:MAG: hypothetical protein JNM04_05880 [Chthonomonas sp.]|nr:hypothetical protein [Chthonomonas sp.]
MATVLGFVGVMWQIQLQRKDVRSRFLSELDRETNDFIGVHQSLMGGGEVWPHDYDALTIEQRTKLHAYLALFERIEICIENGAIDEQSVHKLFGLRMKTLFGHPLTNEVLDGKTGEHFVLARRLKSRMVT